MPSAPRGRRVLYVALGVLTLTVVGILAAFVSVWRRPPIAGPQPVRPATAVGDTTCLSCHTDKAAFETTAHRLTMRRPSHGAILGSFREGENVVRPRGAAAYFRMHADSAGFYQTAVVGRAPDTTVHTARIDVVAGSGRRGQSFLHWAEGRLFQMPVSYWTGAAAWVESPGEVHVSAGENFRRTIAPRCLECHATWVEPVPDPAVTNRFDSTGAILGITCERCHASGREHVARARSALGGVRAPSIVNPARLSRERQLEACAQCHGGIGTPKAQPFTYVAGRPLAEYLRLPPPSNAETVEIHGDYTAALARSACFQSSQMTCGTCHDPHRTERDPVALSGKCMTCHQQQSCGLFPKRGAAIAGKCVDCHMPRLSSNVSVSDDLASAQGRAELRSHVIKVYRDTAGR